MKHAVFCNGSNCQPFWSGGVLLTIALYTLDDGHYTGSHMGKLGFHRTMQKFWEKIYEEGRITKVDNLLVKP